jgi:hypothetical protein
MPDRAVSSKASKGVSHKGHSDRESDQEMWTDQQRELGESLIEFQHVSF